MGDIPEGGLKVERDPITVEFFPDRLTVDDFIRALRGDLDAFADNMRRLPGMEPVRFAEEWFRTLGAWMELHDPPSEEG